MSHLFHYALHRRLLASDSELPLLARAEEGEPRLKVRLRMSSESPPAASPWYRESLVIDRTADGDLIARFPDATTFRIAHDGSAIELLSAPEQYTRDDVAAYALGPVLAVALHLQGAVILHAASVVMRDKALLFCGASGSGKSTTAAIFHQHGYAVLSDDLTEIDGAFALPSIAAMRLWPDTLDTLYGSSAAFPDRAPSWDKKVVRTDVVDRPHEIATILFLEPMADTPRLQRLSPKDGWLRLMANAYTARLPDPPMSQKIFDATSTLADRVPMFALTPPPLTTARALPDFLERELDAWLR